MGKMKIFFSGGEGNLSFPPERVLEGSDVMCSYWVFYKGGTGRPTQRLRRLFKKHRVRKRRNENESQP